MQTNILPLAIAAALPAMLPSLVAAAPPSFEKKTLDDDVEIGYGLVIGDVDGDGKEDIILADKREFRWYENPTWEPHLIAKNLSLRDNVCVAARDLDGDGKVEIAVGANWNPGETSDRDKSGSVHYLLRPDDPKSQAWKAVKLPHDPTTHRMQWIRRDDGRSALAVLPLHGIDNKGGAGDTVRLGVYFLPDNPGNASDWKIEYVDTTLHKAHNFDLFNAGEQGEKLVIGGAEGAVIWPPGNVGDPVYPIVPDDPYGFGEVRAAEGFGAGISPMHGNQVRFVSEAKQTTLDESLNQGHALAIGDLLGTGTPQIIAGWRNPDSDGKVGIRLYSPDDTFSTWTTHTIDDNTVACEDLKLADLDGDEDLDIVAVGRATNNLVIFWNKLK